MEQPAASSGKPNWVEALEEAHKILRDIPTGSTCSDGDEKFSDIDLRRAYAFMDLAKLLKG